MAAHSEEAVLTHTDHIKQLNGIDQNVAKLLQCAGLAVKALTKPSSLERGNESQELPSTQIQKKEFTEATTQYFDLLSSIDIELRQQIHALEEADILPIEAAVRENQVDSDPLPASSAGAGAGAGAKPPGSIRSDVINGGLGNLDVGWLNSRNDNVEKEMEAELWKKASAFLAEVERSKEKDSKESIPQQ
ncbi:MAG: hypothetical protein Q9191_001867 [Dirinaria sp. TL-2023a]